MMERSATLILYAENDPEMAKSCSDLLKVHGYKVANAGDGEEAWKLYRQLRPDVVLLNILLPEKDGYQVAELIRAEDQQVPILFVSGFGHSRNAVTGLEQGGDDFIWSEFLLEEVDARIQAVFRRKMLALESTKAYRIGMETLFFYADNRLIIMGKTVALTSMISQILLILVENRNKVISKSELSIRIWNQYSRNHRRYLDKYVVALRKILEEDTSIELLTVHGEGITLRQPTAWNVE